MKIALTCSHGGHLTEMFYLIDAFDGHDIFFITYESFRTQTLNHKKYLLKNIDKNPFKMILAFFKIFWILFKERPKVVVSTGSEIAIPTLYIAKLMRIKTVFIESWCRVKNPSGAGRLVYDVSDIFLVQWPLLLNKYGDKTKYFGGVA